jgi:type I restriction enzyme S subunit
MTEWRDCKFGEIATFSYGKMPNKKNIVDCGYPIFSGYKIVGYYNSYMYKDPQLIIVARGVGGTGDVKISPPKSYITNLSIIAELHPDKANKKFLYYYFKINNLRELDSGSAQSQITINDLNNYCITLPPLPEQKAIAEVLSSLDDKIDLLTRQNKTLEDLAQAYFRKWFIEDASSEWEVGKAKDYFEIGIGKTPPRKEEHWFSKNNNDVVWVSISDMGKAGMFIGDSSEYLTKNAVKQFNIKRVPKGAIILSFKLTVGRVAIALRDFTTNEAIAHFIYRNLYEREYLYFYLKTFDYYSLGSTSSIATAVNSKIIKDMPFVMPDVETLKKYHKIAAPMFSKIESNTNQILTLQKIRDTLLPKLISGEIRVKM